MKFHTDVTTHLTHETYCRNLSLIDLICKEKDIPVYVWRINDKVDWPKKFDTYSKLSNTKIFPQSAESWINEYQGIDITKTQVDEEHYSVDTHKLIAHKFIPELLND